MSNIMEYMSASNVARFGSGPIWNINCWPAELALPVLERLVEASIMDDHVRGVDNFAVVKDASADINVPFNIKVLERDLHWSVEIDKILFNKDRLFRLFTFEDKRFKRWISKQKFCNLQEIRNVEVNMIVSLDAGNVNGEKVFQPWMRWCMNRGLQMLNYIRQELTGLECVKLDCEVMVHSSQTLEAELFKSIAAELRAAFGMWRPKRVFGITIAGNWGVPFLSIKE